MKLIIAACGTALALAGCAGTTTQPVAPAPTVTVTAQPTTPTPTPTPTVESESLGVSLLNAAWHQQSKSSRNSMCIAYDISPAYIWRSFKQELTNPDLSGLTKYEFYAFMDEHC